MAMRDACHFMLNDPSMIRKYRIRELARAADLPGPEHDHQTLGRFIKNPATITPKKQGVIFPVLWKFLHSPQNLHIIKTSLSKNYSSEHIELCQLSLELNAFFNPVPSSAKGERKRPQIDTAKLKNFAGSYELIRPHFVFPDERIMICALECGVSKDPTGWTLEMRYSTPDKPDAKDTASGYFVPYGGNYLFLGKLDRQVAPFIFIAEPKGTTGVNRQPTNAKGTILAGVLGALPSAYPFYLLRVPRKASAREISLEQFTEEYSSDLRGYGLLRGATFWE